MVSIFTVDAFTDTPFSGNPAGVCIVPRSENDNSKWSLSDEVMQNIATEMNISETSFITNYERTLSNVFELRWMTPTVEVNLCGHGTLSAAAVIFQKPRKVFILRAGGTDLCRSGRWLRSFLFLSTASHVTC